MNKALQKLKIESLLFIIIFKIFAILELNYGKAESVFPKLIKHV